LPVDGDVPGNLERVLDNDHVICKLPDRGRFSFLLLARWPHDKPIIAILKKLLLIRSTHIVVGGPVDQLLVDVTQPALIVNLALHLKGYLANSRAYPGSPLTDQSVNPLLLVCLDDLGLDLVGLGRMRDATLQGRVDGALGEY